MQKYSLWIEAEQWENGWDINDVNSDVILEFEDGSRWIATFVTYININTLVEKNQKTGECLSGKYFWGSDIILIDKFDRNQVGEVIEDLFKENKFEMVFTRIED